MIRDIKPPVYFKTNFAFIAILTSIVLLILLFFLAFFVYKKTKKAKPRPKLPSKSAHEIACEALEKLKAKNLPALGKIKEYYSELSDIVRRYTESTFRIRAPEMTTEEFLYLLRNSATLSGVHKNLLKEFLALSDIVKFARYGPSEKEIEDSFNAAKKFVDETK